MVNTKISNGMIKVIKLSCILVWFSEFNVKKCLFLTTKSISNRVSYCTVSSHMQSYHVLCIETMSLGQGLFTGSSVVFELYLVCY